MDGGVCAWICVCLHCVCMHARVCMDVFACVYVWVCLHECVCICLMVYAYVCLHVCVCTFSTNMMPLAGCMSLSGDSRLSAFDYTQSSPKPL